MALDSPGSPPLEEPWRRRPDWAAGRVVDESTTAGSDFGLVAGWLFVLAWFGGLAAIAYVLRGVADHRTAYLILGGFAATGLLPLAFVVRDTRMRLRFGRSVFAMTTVPGVLGGRLEGTIELPVRLDEGARLRVTLTCWQRSLHRDFADHVVWETGTIAAPDPAGPPGRVPVSFEIPFECSASHPGRPRGGIYWMLAVEGTENARGIEGRFVVPVFPTPASRPRGEGGPSAPTPRPTASAVVVEALGPGHLRLRFRYGPLGWFFVVFLPLALPVVLLAASQARWEDRPLPVPWTTAVVVTALVVAFALTTHLVEPMGVEVDAGQVTLRHGFRGWFRPRRIPLSDVMAVNLKECVNHLQQVVLRTRQLEDLDVSQVTTVMEARWIAQELRRAIADAGIRIPE